MRVVADRGGLVRRVTQVSQIVRNLAYFGLKVRKRGKALTCSFTRGKQEKQVG